MVAPFIKRRRRAEAAAKEAAAKKAAEEAAAKEAAAKKVAAKPVPAAAPKKAVRPDPKKKVVLKDIEE